MCSNFRLQVMDQSQSYKELRRSINRKAKAKKVGDEVEYVDQHRNVAVVFDSSGDLKSAMAKTGLKSLVAALQRQQSDEPDHVLYLKQAEHLMKRSTYAVITYSNVKIFNINLHFSLQPALVYLDQALSMNPASKAAHCAKAKCYLLMGKWLEASKAADVVLKVDKKYYKALLVKAEALYNTCYFEHAAVLFHRGQTIAPDVPQFRLGVQKCGKTIEATLSPNFKFVYPGVEKFFTVLRRECQLTSSMSKAELRKMKR